MSLQNGMASTLAEEQARAKANKKEGAGTTHASVPTPSFILTDYLNPETHFNRRIKPTSLRQELHTLAI